MTEPGYRDFPPAEVVQELAAKILTQLGPDPYAYDHMQTLKRAIGLHCAIQGCDNDHRSNGFCENHYRHHLRAVASEAHTINSRRIA